MSETIRLDRRLVEQGLISGRDKACEVIRAGQVTVNGVCCRKPAFPVRDSDAVAITVELSDYVGRGGLKLEQALQEAALPPTFVAMDVGASTGGFTDCLLRRGATRVYAVDVGHGQLHPRLCADDRVVNLEGTDIRSEALSQRVPLSSVEVLTMDVSFISLKNALPAVFPYLTETATLFLLIKPQFEAGRSDVGKNGIVSDPAVHVRILRELMAYFATQGCALRWLRPSPIRGGAGRLSGNIEYMAVLSRGSDTAVPTDLRRLVTEAFASNKTHPKG